MSKVSEISRQYHDALASSREDYTRLYQENSEATLNFYQEFFKDQVCTFQQRFSNPRFRQKMHEVLNRYLGTDRLSFMAIDGSCQKQQFSDFITFSGVAYGSKGVLEWDGEKHRIHYHRWSLQQDVSMVAWVPIPFASMEDVVHQEGDSFLVTEEEKINLASIHVQLMQLAEIFLAYNTVQSSKLDAPNLMLMDLLPSSVMASSARNLEKVGLIHYPYERRPLSKADLILAMARPCSHQMGIPSTRKMDLYRIIISELIQNPEKSIHLPDLAKQRKVKLSTLQNEADFLCKREVLDKLDSENYHPRVRADHSWSYVRDFFQNICEQLFMNKNPDALKYEVPDEMGRLRKRWMSPEDVGFLIAVGVRLLIETCWQKKVLLYGIAKDSTSSYLTKNYLGVALQTGFQPKLREMKFGILPWTDRIFCETLPLIDESLQAPWSTVEFDSAFMTLHRERDPQTQQPKVAGVMGRIVNQERLFAKSLAQFYLTREKRTPLMGHVIFLERLMAPNWDRPGTDQGPSDVKIETQELGRFSVFAWKDKDHFNQGQMIMMFLLSVLIRNHYAEAIGYPDPLHKADWGAKTLGRKLGHTVKSSTTLLDSQPLSRTFRDIRDSRRR